MTTATKESKFTYTTMGADMGEFHRQFDRAVVQVKKELGKTYPMYIGGKKVESPEGPIVDASPIDTDIVLGNFQAANASHVDLAVEAARDAAPKWASTPWQERVSILRKAAAKIRERKFEFAALMSLEVG